MSQFRKRADSLNELESGGKRAKANKSDSPICDRCSSVPWPSVAQEIPDEDGKVVFKLSESHDNLRQSACKFCQILATIKPPSLDGTNCYLVALSARKALAWTTVKTLNDLSFIDTTLLVVAPPNKRWIKSSEGGFLSVLHSACQNFDVGPRELESGKANFNLVKEWRTRCSQCHRKTCSPKVITFNGLRVINCLTKRVEIAHPKCHYVALSYVWGTSVSSTSNLSITT